MIRLRPGLLPAILAAAFILSPVGPCGAAAPKPPSVDAQVAQLEATREQAIATALAVKQRERSIGALDLAVGVMTRGAETKQQELVESRKEQEQLIGALARLARTPPEALAFAPEGPVERLRSGVLIAAAVPALADQARMLTGQLSALNTVKTHITTRRKEVDDARAALDKSRQTLAQLLVKRADLTGQILRDDGKPPTGDKLAEQASDLFDLIKRADAETDRRDKELLIRLRTSGPITKGAPPPLDPTKPKTVRSLDAPKTAMLWPVSGDLVHRFGEADQYGRPSQGVTLSAVPNALVVAPFDGRVDFVGTFRGYGLILIIRHSGGYHSLLTGLGHADVTIGQWLLSGEPVGTLAAADDKNASATFYLELRRDGRPVDPQSRLASRDEKTEDNRVRE